MRHIHPHRSDLCFASRAAGVLVEIGSATEEEGAPVAATEHAGEHPAARHDLLEDLAAFGDPADTTADRVGNPGGAR